MTIENRAFSSAVSFAAAALVLDCLVAVVVAVELDGGGTAGDAERPADGAGAAGLNLDFLVSAGLSVLTTGSGVGSR